MKKYVFGLLACMTLLVVSCETNDITEEDAVYEEAIDRKIKTIPRHGIDRKIKTIPRHG